MILKAFDCEELRKLKAKLNSAEEHRLSGHVGISLEDSRNKLGKILDLKSIHKKNR